MGEVYLGKVTHFDGIRCFVEVLPGKEGLVHFQTAERRVENVEKT